LIADHVAGVPRYMDRTLLKHVQKMIAAHLRRDPAAAFEHELWLFFFAGILKQRLSERKVAIPSSQVNWT
jgi:hypothetical protein